jgi:hypothetical protein
MDRSNHYEAAFEAYLQERRLCYVGVDEKRRSTLGEAPVKNLDFIVLGHNGVRLLVDIKGRRFPGQSNGKERYTWECWSTADDVSGLLRWRQIFGSDYQALLLFIYDLQPSISVPEDTADLWSWRGRRYLLRAVPIDPYRQHMRRRSSRWGTVTLPSSLFRQLVKPFAHFSQEAAEAHEVEAGGMSALTGVALAAGACGVSAAGAGWR